LFTSSYYILIRKLNINVDLNGKPMKTDMNTHAAQTLMAQTVVREEMVNEVSTFAGAANQSLKAPRLRLLKRREVRRNRRLAH
jgi:hypothetical protein